MTSPVAIAAVEQGFEKQARAALEESWKALVCRGRYALLAGHRERLGM
jgi:hypothetical protein